MLKFKVDLVKVDNEDKAHGKLDGLQVSVRDHCIFSVDRTRGGYVQLWDVSGTRQPAASPNHAFEMGVRAAARWIAVALLADPKPPAKGKMVTDVALWLTKRAKDNHELFLMTQKAAQGTMGVFSKSHHFCTVYGLIDLPSIAIPVANRASSEGAIAKIIEHAAPWIAAALVEEAKL